jgi:hypothetical protein
MKHYNFDSVQRITKRKAEQLYNYGFDVLFIPCNLNPENNFYNLGIWENVNLSGQYDNFEKLVNAFTYYNCNSETGKYIAFYMKRETIWIHFEFSDGSNPYIFKGSPLECLEELERWEKRFNITVIKQGFYSLQEV